MDDEETVLLIDSWTDQEALDKHHASPMMTRITELREKYDLHMKVERYVSDVTDPLIKDCVYKKITRVQSLILVLGTSAVSTDVPSTYLKDESFVTHVKLKKDHLFFSHSRSVKILAGMRVSQ